MILATLTEEQDIRIELACDVCGQPIERWCTATFTHPDQPGSQAGTPVHVVHKGQCDRNAGRERFSHDGHKVVTEWADRGCDVGD